jgi:hypothetical protein
MKEETQMDDLSFEQGALAALESFRDASLAFKLEMNAEADPHAALLEVLENVIDEQRRSVLALTILDGFSRKVRAN